MTSEFRFWYGLLLSLVIHFTFVMASRFVPPPPPHPENIEVTIDSPDSRQKKKKQEKMVRAADVPERMKAKDSDDPLRFLSEKTQRVKEQMRAAQIGMTQNRGRPSSSTAPATNRNGTDSVPDKHESTTRAMDKDGLSKFLPRFTARSHARRDLQQMAARPPETNGMTDTAGVSTIGNQLPDSIKIGDITALNNDRYLFYSYYARAEELLRNQWEPMLGGLMERPPPRLLTATRNNYTTIVEAWFKANGEVHSVHVLKESGIPDFDRAASEAFRRAAMIPNPPKEKIERDGIVRIKWTFTVSFDPRALVRR